MTVHIVLKQPFPEFEGLERAKRPQRVPTVFTAEETQAILAQLKGAPHLMADLLDGADSKRDLSASPAGAQPPATPLADPGARRVLGVVCTPRRDVGR